MRIAVDAMGGDHAPAEIVRGAAQAAGEFGLDISLVGLPAAVQPLLDSHPRLQLVPCTQVIGMDEHPAQAVRVKPDSSICVCARLCKEGRVAGWTSAGNSGAIMAAALLIQGRIRGVERPALGSIVPTQNGFAYFLDVGANVDSKPDYLVQFAAMGEVYAREMLGRPEPRVALLSNGEEEGKGDELVRETSRRLRSTMPGFIGNVEPKDIYGARADVVVADGFVGNIAIKMAEATAEFLFRTLRDEIPKTLPGMLGGLLIRTGVRQIRERIDWREFGGAPLLGIDGVAVVAHGMRNGRTRVVVTGMGTVNPLGKDLEEYWNGLIEGRSGASPIERFPSDRLPTKFACQVNTFNAQDYIERKTASRMARFSQMAVAASGMALTDSGIDLSKEDDYRVGVAMGTGIGGFDEMTQGAISFATKGRLNPLYAPMIIPNMAGASVAMQFHLHGPNTTVTTACAASTQTLGEATRMIQRGDADVMLAGGAEASLCEVGIAAFNAIRALSTRNDAPERASRPFDRDRDGFVPGEGAGTLILESREHAINRGARIYGEVLGYATTNDAYHQVAPDETGEAPAKAVVLALKDAGLQPEDIDYVNAHGTSTQLNDAGETKALKIALGDHAHKVAISSTKSMIGHLLGAAGAVEAIATLLTINRGIIHPTINYENPDPDCDLDYVPNTARRKDVRIAISNGFGFGGHNAVVVLARYQE
ncbi:MAG: beta-ketoacyl-ACP synthase II [Chloroflexi bacterium]|nr:MAG: beta-ketoacyl-ACP synthase II [Chloroflexota bacterium]